MGLDLEGGQSGPHLVHHTVSLALETLVPGLGSLAWLTGIFFSLLRESPQGSVCVCAHPSSSFWFALVLVDSAPRPALGGLSSGVLCLMVEAACELW